MDDLDESKQAAMPLPKMRKAKIQMNNKKLYSILDDAVGNFLYALTSMVF
jgi:hypothetical protein